LSDDEDGDDDDDGGFSFSKMFGAGSKMPGASAMRKPKKPAVDTVAVGCSKLKIPVVVFCWKDEAGFDRGTIVGHLPSGAFKKGCITADISKNQIVAIKFDYSHLTMLNPMKYNKAFKDNKDNTIYDESHSRTVQHKEVVKKMKGHSSTTPLVAEMKITMPMWVENKFTDAEGFSGFTVFKAGNEENPQLIINLELMGKQSGHDDKQPGGYEDCCESDSSASSSSDDSYSD